MRPLYFNSWFNTWFAWAWAPTNINTDPSCDRIMDPDMTTSNSLGLKITTDLGSSIYLSDWNGPSSSNMVPKFQHGPRWL